jgi:NtrC-family two-component system sensor histidine kinase KinB
MKLAMTLRTRLFLSISALITVALLGLLLGLVGVMQMAGTQEALIRDNFVTLDLGLKLRQTLGDQLIIMLDEQPDPAAFEASKQHSLELFDEGIAREPSSEGAQYGFKKAKADYQNLLQSFDFSSAPIQW